MLKKVAGALHQVVAARVGVGIAEQYLAVDLGERGEECVGLFVVSSSRVTGWYATTVGGC